MSETNIANHFSYAKEFSDENSFIDDKNRDFEDAETLDDFESFDDDDILYGTFDSEEFDDELSTDCQE